MNDSKEQLKKGLIPALEGEGSYSDISLQFLNPSSTVQKKNDLKINITVKTWPQLIVHLLLNICLPLNRENFLDIFFLQLIATKSWLYFFNFYLARKVYKSRFEKQRQSNFQFCVKIRQNGTLLFTIIVITFTISDPFE